MAHHYSDEDRASDKYSLPDMEVWEDTITIIRSDCGEFEVSRDSESARGFCPSCDRATCVHDLSTNPDETGVLHTERTGWFGWYCFPGCLPEGDGQPSGPYETEAEAIAALRDAADY